MTLLTQRYKQLRQQEASQNLPSFDIHIIQVGILSFFPMNQFQQQELFKSTYGSNSLVEHKQIHKLKETTIQSTKWNAHDNIVKVLCTSCVPQTIHPQSIVLFLPLIKKIVLFLPSNSISFFTSNSISGVQCT